jgi:transcriptional regulator with XRE-family HTH domain
VKDPRKQFGVNVRKMRSTRGLSQETLADDAGLHRTYIGAVERGETNISLMNMVKIAKGLQVSLAELIAGID